MPNPKILDEWLKKVKSVSVKREVKKEDTRKRTGFFERLGEIRYPHVSVSIKFQKREKQNREKLNILLLARKKVIVASSLAICLALLFGTFLVEKPKTVGGDNRIFASLASITASQNDKKSLDNLSKDFGNVQKFEVANAKGTVVYFPQVHKDPTTKANDSTNDLAAQAQQEIYQGLTKVVDDYGVKYVMDETDYYGPMPSDKVEKIKTGFSDIDTFRSNTDAVITKYLADGGDKATADKMKSDSETYIAKYERNIYLTGGAAALAAKDSNAVVYGSQNQATIAKATDMLQDIQYLEARINQLQQTQSPLTKLLGGKSSGSAALASLPSGASSSQITNLLSQLNIGSSSASSIFVPAQKEAQSQSDQNLTDAVNQANVQSKKLSTSENFESKPMLSDRQATTNPYANRTDLANLQSEYNQKYADFMKIAKDQRSQEVADNVVKMMTDNGQDEATLVLGAQHQDQIVQDLNAKGYSVVVITTDKVKQYQAANPSS